MGDSIAYMDLKNIPNINSGEFRDVIAEARRTGDFSGDRLGELIANIVKKVIARDFNIYTEDWQSEMFSEGCVCILDAVKNGSCNMNDAFTYCFTAVRNRLFRVVNRLRANIPEETLNEISDNPQYMKTKRKLLRGFFDSKQERDVMNRIFKRPPLLKNAVGVSARCFSEALSGNELDSLLERARNLRTA